MTGMARIEWLPAAMQTCTYTCRDTAKDIARDHDELKEYNKAVRKVQRVWIQPAAEARGPSRSECGVPVAAAARFGAMFSLRWEGR